jgi:branched-chain amino acid transport system substrate-binding protein
VKNTEGIFYTVSWDAKAKTPGNAEFVADYAKKYNGASPAEDAADAFAAAQVLQAAAKGAGSLDQAKMATWLHANTVDTILGPLAWDATGAPTKQFLLGQWQSGSAEVVGPKEAATVDKVVAKTPWQ